MTIRPTIAVGSTRVARVQFGVPLNCVGGRTICVTRMDNGSLRLPDVSGATPETTRETRVLPCFSTHFRTSTIKFK